MITPLFVLIVTHRPFLQMCHLQLEISGLEAEKPSQVAHLQEKPLQVAHLQENAPKWMPTNADLLSGFRQKENNYSDVGSKKDENGEVINSFLPESSLEVGIGSASFNVQLPKMCL